MDEIEDELKSNKENMQTNRQPRHMMWKLLGKYVLYSHRDGN